MIQIFIFPRDPLKTLIVPSSIQQASYSRIFSHDSKVLPEELIERLKDQLDWIREEMPSWLTPQQRELGFSFYSLTLNWWRKRPVWLRECWRYYLLQINLILLHLAANPGKLIDFLILDHHYLIMILLEAYEFYIY